MELSIWQYLSFVLLYVFIGGSFFAVFAMLEDKPIKNHLATSLAILFLWPGFLTLIALVISFALGLILTDTLISFIKGSTK